MRYDAGKVIVRGHPLMHRTHGAVYSEISEPVHFLVLYVRCWYDDQRCWVRAPVRREAAQSREDEGGEDGATRAPCESSYWEKCSW